MNARITVDLAAVYPVFDGRWHRTRLAHFPAPGERIVTFCGASEDAEFVVGEPDPRVSTCWSCDLAYRRQEGVPYLPDHPGLRAEGVQPSQRPPAD